MYARQDTFDAIQEVVRMLEADSESDWSKVNLEALPQAHRLFSITRAFCLRISSRPGRRLTAST